MKKLVPIVLLAMAAGGFYYYRSELWRNSESGGLVLSGNIEVTDAQIGFKIPGRLLERLAEEGDTVAAGQALARLEGADQENQLAQAEANESFARAFLAELEAGTRSQDLEAAHAAMEQARFRLDELEAGSRTQEVAAAAAEVEMLRAEAERAAADAGRFTRLLEQKAVTPQQHEAVTTQARMAAERLASAEERLKLVREGPRTEQIDQARAALRQVEERYALAKEGPRVEQLEQARAKLAAASAAVSHAKQQLDYAELKAPFDGIILSKAAEPGEYLLPGAPVVTLGDLGNPWLRAYVSETDLGRVRLGQAAQVTCDSWPGRVFKGKVTYISGEAEFTPKQVQTPEERVKLVYRIKIALENEDLALKPGMPADARLGPGQ
ncbi:MAG: Cobalt-zinc-cadmium resistance protein CzcB [Candidatus Hydrogenedentes bacterium ADurb.Bin179]|nr:MAG: Cobalt-zinc-cadmium resistance protein CzcB [Candidatus Hydrogenedentes bacterium ADurb.Bin179]